MIPRLTKYWISFEAMAKPNALSLGCGVTALSEADALQLIEQRIVRENPGLVGGAVLTGIAISDLDEHHVRPNMGDPTIKGIWFPQEY